MKTSSLVSIFIACVLIATFSLLAAPVSAQDETPTPDRMIPYKTVGDVELNLHVFDPKGEAPEAGRPAIIFYFGGGWSGGSPSQFYHHCRELADLGILAMSAEYRVKSRNNTTPFECVADGKSAVRYVRIHAEELGVDPEKVLVGGGSAGGHVAACTGTIQGLDEPGEDLQVSSVPVAMCLFNPVIDTGPDGYGYSKLLERYEEISPVEHVRADVPPTILFHGTTDTTVPFANAEMFEERMEAAGARCELVAYEGQKHGFFNYGRSDNEFYLDSVAKMKDFLRSLGYIGEED